MIKDEDITFITTSIYTKWLEHSQKCISKYFPNSKKIIINGSSRWPMVWFDWIKELPSIASKWVIHIDEDCFISSRTEIERLVEIMEKGNYSVSGVSDGFHQYRNGNPVALNSFFMVCKKDDIIKSFSSVTLPIIGTSQILGIGYGSDSRFISTFKTDSKSGLTENYIDKFGEGFIYPHEIMGGESDRRINWEPYYPFFFSLLDNGFKIHYLYPHFDQELKATVPRIDKDSGDLCTHMWYSRSWQSEELVHGVTNKERYKKLEENYFKK